MTTWYGVFAPAGTPKDIVVKLNAEIMKALQTPEVKTRIAGLAGEPGTLTIEQFAALNRADYERFGKLVKEANIKLDE